MNVVWDLGGVLLRWRPAELVQRLWPQRVRDAASAAQWRSAIFGPEWLEFDRGGIGVSELLAQLALKTSMSADELSPLIAEAQAELQPDPDAVALLGEVERRADAQFYLSNMPAPLADHLERTHDLFGRFKQGLFSSRVLMVKPDPDLFALAQEQFGVQGKDVVFIDDHEPNVLAARAFGWQALHFSTPARARDELRALGLA